MFGDKKVIEKKPRFWGPRRIIYVRYVNWLMIIPEITGVSNTSKPASVGVNYLKVYQESFKGESGEITVFMAHRMINYLHQKHKDPVTWIKTGDEVF